MKLFLTFLLCVSVAGGFAVFLNLGPFMGFLLGCLMGTLAVWLAEWWKSR